jgi:hypothetical protein
MSASKRRMAQRTRSNQQRNRRIQFANQKKVAKIELKKES